MGVLAIVGPTAVGKTAVAVELAGLTDAEIVSADSMAVYRGMDLATAKPTAEERARARFHLVDVTDPSEAFSAGRFQQSAVAAINDILSRGKTAMLVGGTGLYVRAALDGLDTGALQANVEIRARLREESAQALWDRLRDVDPGTASRLHPKDLKRIVRALEIFEITGMPASKVYKEAGPRAANYPGVRRFGLTMERAALYARIETRIDRQLAEGLVDEIRRLLDSGVEPGCVAMQGLGYKQMARYLLGESGFEEAVFLFKRDTRRFAKRQWTWFRADPRIRWIDVGDLSPRQTAELIFEEVSGA